jgi:hypothetical protein
MRIHPVHWLFLVAAVGLLAGCKDSTLKLHQGGDGGEEAGTSPGVEAGGERGGAKDASAATPDGPGVGLDAYPDTKPIAAADASVPDVPGAGVDAYPDAHPVVTTDAVASDAPGAGIDVTSDIAAVVTADGSVRDASPTGIDAYPEVSPTLYGLSGGDNCYTITAIAPGYSDGCMLGVVTLTGQSLPMNYWGETGTVALGASGSLGSGAIRYNQGTLIREGDTSFAGTTCTLHQTDTTQLQMLANDKFTVSVTEVESNFSPTCGADAPAGGTCTSTWTWTMQRATDSMLVPPFCQRTP